MCPGHRVAGVIEVRDFTVDITDAQINDLRDRLARARLPEAETVDDWSQGIPLAYLRELSEYWTRDYDMRRVATRLNALPQFHASIDELGVHFLHIRSAHAQARPLIMTHGWPGSVLEFLNVIGPLTDPLAHGGTAEDAFHLVVPALPGYGFSDKPTRAGTGVPRIAAAWHQLMGHLGYPEYYAQGGDLGAMVTVAMGNQRPEGLLGIHVNMALASPAALQTLGEPTTEEQETDQQRNFFRPAVLGELPEPGCRRGPRAQRLLAFPQGAVLGERALAAHPVHRPALLPPDRAGRPFRRARTARHLRTRGP
jgi:pimeloyl-ACP methyl ester carboxylesterase